MKHDLSFVDNNKFQKRKHETEECLKHNTKINFIHLISYSMANIHFTVSQIIAILSKGHVNVLQI